MTELETLLRRIVGKDQGGFLLKADVADLARLDRLRMLLVRCGGGRFLAAAQDVEHFREIITRDDFDYVRDVSLPCSDRVYTRFGADRWLPFTEPAPSTRKPIIDPIPLPAGAPRGNWLTRGNSMDFSPSDADPGL